MWKLYFSLFTFFVINQFGCSSIGNRLNDDVLNCGENVSANGQYFIVNSPDGRRLKRSDFEIIRIESGDKTGGISSKGCVNKPLAGQYLVRSVKSNWSKVVQIDQSLKFESITLTDFSTQAVAVVCDQTIRTSANRDLALRSILAENVSDDLKNGYNIEVEVTNASKKYRWRNIINLATLSDKTKIFEAKILEGDFDLQVTIRNLALGGSESKKTCPFRVDTTPPTGEIFVNQSRSSRLISYSDIENITVLNPGDRLTFSSNDPDTRSISYCLERMDDNKLDGLTNKSTWILAGKSRSCSPDTLIDTQLNIPVEIPQLNGFWSIRFFANDKLGNRSITKNSVILHLQKNSFDRLKEINDATYAQIEGSDRTLEMATEALKSRLIMQKLPTHYERELAYKTVLSIFLNAGRFPAIDTNGQLRIGNMRTFSVTRDSKRLVGLSTEGLFGIWDTHSGELIRNFGTLSDEIRDILINESGTLVYTLSNGIVGFWDMNTGVLIKSIRTRSKSYTTFKLSNDESRVLVGDTTGSVAIFNANTLRLVKEMPSLFADGDSENRQITYIDVNRDDKSFAITCRCSKDFKIIDLQSGETLKNFTGHNDSVEYVKFSKYENRIFSVSVDNSAIVWDIETLEPKRKVSGDFRSSIWDASLPGISQDHIKFRGKRIPAQISRDETVLISGMDNGRIEAFDLKTGVKVFQYNGLSDNISNVEISETQQTIFASRINGPIMILNLNQNYLRADHSARNYSIVDEANLHISKDNLTVKYFSSEGYFGRINAGVKFQEKWDDRSYKLSWKNGTFSPDGSRVAAVTTFGVDVLDFAQRKITLQWTPASSILNFSPDGQTIIATDGAGLNFHNSQTGSIQRSLPLQTHIAQAEFSSDGKLLFLSNRYKIEVYDVQTLKEVQIVDPSYDYIDEFSISDGGSRILVIGEKASIWDIESGKMLGEVENRRGNFKLGKFGKDGRTFVTADDLGSVKIWDAEQFKLLTILKEGLSSETVHNAYSKQKYVGINFSDDQNLLILSTTDARLEMVDYDIDIMKRALCDQINHLVVSELCK